MKLQVLSIVAVSTIATAAHSKPAPQPACTKCEQKVLKELEQLNATETTSQGQLGQLVQKMGELQAQLVQLNAAAARSIKKSPVVVPVSIPTNASANLSLCSTIGYAKVAYPAEPGSSSPVIICHD